MLAENLSYIVIEKKKILSLKDNTKRENVPSVYEDSALNIMAMPIAEQDQCLHGSSASPVPQILIVS